jgi:teichuronic acid biosynthesis glycosyltransferase TuaG
MPSYNHGKYLSEAIESVLNQSFKDFELLILDDCSKDNSQKIIETYQRRDVRIRALFHKKNMGIAKTLNDLLAEAKGTYVAFNASDDVWEMSKLEKQLAILQKDDSLIVWSEGKLIDSDGVSTGETFTQNQLAVHKKKSGNLFEVLVERNFIFGSTVILKRSSVEGVQFSEKLKYYNDCKFFIDLSRCHLFFFIPEPLARYRVHRKNAHLTDEKGWMSDEIAFVRLILEEYGNYLSNRIKAGWLLLVGVAYSYFGEKASARRTVFKAIGLDPFCRRNFGFLIFALTNGDDYIAKFFVAFRSYYNGMFSSGLRHGL